MRRLLRAGSLLTASGILLLVASGPATAGVSNQWALQKLRAQEAWKYSQGRGVIVGLADTGVDASHPDLQDVVMPGRDFVGSSDGRTDVGGHGTGMASIIAGQGVTAAGVRGLAPAAKIFPLRTSEWGSNDPAAVEKAIPEVVAKGVKVLNLSMASYNLDPELAKDNPEKTAIEYALRHDVVVVAGAGNNANSRPAYPAGYAGVIAVTAVDEHGKPWAKTGHGPWVTVAAPGVGIYTARPGGKYKTVDGTSSATAYVSATVALIRAKYPELSANQVIHRLIKTADDCGPPGRDDYCGYGMINPVRALTEDVGEWPRDKNPLAPELTAAQPTQQPQANGDTNAGGPGVLVWALGGLLAVGAVIALVVLLARRGGNRNQSPGGGGWPPPPGPPGPYGPPPGPQYQQAGAPPGPWQQPGPPPPPPPGWQQPRR
ncbi:type VII secretion-associated serine protease mycosin [Carbonactinospora thermoautotrophica]|uniref:type VII secretion-associated serine protease mycosin n=1 Tax=Carbonactinospora thermoautotrophica TaxID=1469144 RepID=UPI00099E4E71|nr:type VII secretion-associated serine protease mycosin [Carbonactinospora thermoautotrophica]